MAKTLICIPCMDNVSALFTASLVSLDKTDATVAFRVGSLVGLAREELAKQAVANDFEWTLWIDSDMTFPKNTLQHMMRVAEKNNLDILTSVCYMRRPPYSPGLFKSFVMHDDLTSDSEIIEEVPDGLFEVDACGFACILVKTKVIVDIVEKYGDAFTQVGTTGEDLSFCWKAKQCGYRIYADSTLNIGHVGQFIVNKDVYESVRRNQN